MPDVQPRVRLYPAAVDADVALAAHLFDPTLRQVRKQPPQVTVKPLIAVVRANYPRLNTAAHANTIRVKVMPKTSAASPIITLPPT